MSRPAAFFDMDRTVVRYNTGPLYLRYALRHRRLSPHQVLVGAWWSLLYKLTLLDTDAAMRRAITAFAGDDSAALSAFCQGYFHQMVQPHISAEARRTIERHRRRREVLVLLTASSTFTSEPLAHHLELDHLLSTRLEADERGVLTGRFVDPPCHGEGKVVWAERLAAEQDLDLDSSTFYTDSFHDLPMLRRVGTPVVINPDLRLRRVAAQQGWRVERWL